MHAASRDQRSSRRTRPDRRFTWPVLTALALVLASPAANAQQGCGDWSLVDPPAGALSVIDVEARSTDDAWAIAYFNPNPKDLIRWDGTTWSAFPTDDVCNEYAAISFEALALAGPSHVLVSARASTGPFSTDQLLLIWDGTNLDNCHTLTLQPDIQGAPRNGAPNAIVAAAANDAWILGRGVGVGDGSGEGYLTVHWDGSELTEEFTSGGPGNASKTFRDGVAFASHDIWAVGQYRIIGQGTPGYHASTYHFDGTSWDYVPNPAETLCCQSTDLNTVAGVAPDDVWAAGSYGSEPLFLHWDGSSWSIVPGPATTGTIHEMVAIASDDVWAVDFWPPAGKFYHWDGSSWSIIPGQEIPGAINVARHGGMAAVGPCDIWTTGSIDFGQGTEPFIERLQSGTTSATPDFELPRLTGITQVSPNPFNPRVEIAFTLERGGPALLTIHDLRGRLVRTLHQGTLDAGRHKIIWNGAGEQGGTMASGTYIVSLQSAGQRHTRKIVMLQ